MERNIDDSFGKLSLPTLMSGYLVVALRASWMAAVSGLKGVSPGRKPAENTTSKVEVLLDYEVCEIVRNAVMITGCWFHEGTDHPATLNVNAVSTLGCAGEGDPHVYPRAPSSMSWRSS